jgi:ketosteroid isomerase-like protein
MKRIAIAVSVLVLVFCVAIQAQTKRESVEQELIKLANGWNEAWANREIAIFDRILADDFIGPDSDGIVLTKAQEIAWLKSGEIVVKSAVADDFKVRVYGDAAVVTYRTTEKGEFKGSDYSGQYRYTDTWVKKTSRWQLGAEHFSKIAQKQ